ncbi:unnamed protein product [Prorocentrum cordatum]|uniref:Uncharacterized protein n=1 Tax=Prorocentrum cordatum TaxID=2364126 RepID=A0ABN9W3C8_9DINO|nr:unnamed protein product [Polarella glacialis]
MEPEQGAAQVARSPAHGVHVAPLRASAALPRRRLPRWRGGGSQVAVWSGGGGEEEEERGGASKKKLAYQRVAPGGCLISQRACRATKHPRNIYLRVDDGCASSRLLMAKFLVVFAHC